MSSRYAAHSPASATSAGGALFQKRMTSGAANTARTSAPSPAASGRMRVCGDEGNGMRTG